MLAEFVARHAAARNIHYGWVMAALGFLYSLFASSALGVPSVLMREIAADAHVSMGELSASQGLRFALFGLVAPFAGGLMLRYGPRMMLSIAGTMALLRHNEALLAPYPGASARAKTAAEQPIASTGLRSGPLHVAYCARPCPNDQFSFAVSTRLITMSSGRPSSCF